MKKINQSKGFTLIEIMVVVVIIGLMAALAIPGFQKARKTSQEKAVFNNLRELASAAQQYFIEEGESTVNVTDLLGTGNYLISLEPVSQEEYPDVINATDESLSTTGSPQITYSF